MEIKVGSKVTYCYKQEFMLAPTPGSVGVVKCIDKDGGLYIEWDKPLVRKTGYKCAYYPSSWVRAVGGGGF